MGKKSKTSQEQTTEVTTQTTTNIRDIGLTGAHAVDLAAVLESGAVEQTQITAGVIQNLVQAAGQGMHELIGGATQLVQTAESTTTELVRTAGQSTQEMIGGATELVQTAEAISYAGLHEKKPIIETLSENLPLVALAAAAAIGFKLIGK